MLARWRWWRDEDHNTPVRPLTSSKATALVVCSARPRATTDASVGPAAQAVLNEQDCTPCIHMQRQPLPRLTLKLLDLPLGLAALLCGRNTHAGRKEQAKQPASCKGASRRSQGRARSHSGRQCLCADTTVTIVRTRGNPCLTGASLKQGCTWPANAECLQGEVLSAAQCPPMGVHRCRQCILWSQQALGIN